MRQQSKTNFLLPPSPDVPPAFTVGSFAERARLSFGKGPLVLWKEPFIFCEKSPCFLSEKVLASAISACAFRLYAGGRMYFTRWKFKPKSASSILQAFAGRRIKFAPGKSLRFSELFLGICLSEFRFPVFIPGAVEWICKSPTPIFSQPIFSNL